LANAYQKWYIRNVNRARPLTVRFYRSLSGREPVREWLQTQDPATKKIVGEDIKKSQKTPEKDLALALNRLRNTVGVVR